MMELEPVNFKTGSVSEFRVLPENIFANSETLLYLQKLCCLPRRRWQSGLLISKSIFCFFQFSSWYLQYSIFFLVNKCCFRKSNAPFEYFMVCAKTKALRVIIEMEYFENIFTFEMLLHLTLFHILYVHIWTLNLRKINLEFI